VPPNPVKQRRNASVAAGVDQRTEGRSPMRAEGEVTADAGPERQRRPGARGRRSGGGLTIDLMTDVV
jgi:hypothetical protein